MTNPKRASAFMLFLLAIYFVVLGFVLPVILGILNMFFYISIHPLWFMIALQILLFILPLYIWLLITKDNINNHLPNMKLGGTNIILLFGLSILLQPLGMLISGIMSMFMQNPVAEMFNMFAEQPLWLLLLAIAVTPAICEEVVFRGYIGSQLKNISIKKAAIINGLFFGIMHMNFHQFTYAFFMGIVFFLFVYYTKSIFAGIIVHFIMNGTQVLLAWAAVMLAEPNGYEPADAGWTVVLSILVIAVICLPGCFILFRTFINHNEQRITKTEMKTIIADGFTPPEPINPYIWYKDMFLWIIVGVFIVYSTISIIIS